ncbi:MAG: flagellar basal body P-ring formation protein FlgA [Gammaproteobacteria bacterium]|nr:flagellar basal body P-ring formation protein FlgA [Gammaproteobacteria bacterium]
MTIFRRFSNRRSPYRRPPYRRPPFCRYWAARCGAVLITFVALAAANAQPPGDLQPHDDIQAAVVEAVEARLASRADRLTVEADEIDSRLRLSRCDVPLSVRVPQGRGSSGRVTTEVRCAGPTQWKIYVPARVVVYQSVVVAARSLQRGSVLAPDDVILAEQDTSSLPYGYVVNVENAIGSRLRRDVLAGKPVLPAMLETPETIKRGQQVTLEARSGAMVVRMAGVAKSDGVMGQVIPVENVKSQRVVHAVVRSGRTVEVLLR